MKRIQIVCVMLFFATMVESMDKKKSDKAEAKRSHRLGIEAYKKGNVKEAGDYFQQAKEYEQKHIDKLSMNKRGIRLCKQKDFLAAEQCFTDAINEGSEEGICNLGLLFYAQNKLPAAEPYLIEGIKLGYHDMLPILEKVYKKQDKDIVTILSKELEGANAVFILNALGMFYMNKDSATAKKCFLLAADKGSAEAVNNLGVLYDDEGNYDTAKVCYKEAVQKGNKAAIDNLNRLCGKLDDHEELEEFFKMCTIADH